MPTVVGLGWRAKTVQQGANSHVAYLNEFHKFHYLFRRVFNLMQFLENGEQ